MIDFENDGLEDESIEAAVYRYVRVSNTKRRIEQQDETSRKLTKYNDDEQEDDDDELNDEISDTNKLNVSERVEQFHQILPNVTSSQKKQVTTSIRSYVPFNNIVEQTKNDVKTKIKTVSRRFSTEEDKLIDNFIDKYCEYEDLTLHDFKKFIWPKPDSSTRPTNFTQFWKFIYSIFNHRSNAALYNHIRRRYHNFRTDSFDPEEITQLRRCVEAYGDEHGNGTPWSSIGYYLNRLPEDCKDFWRHYRKVHKQIKNTKKWTKIEELKMINIVSATLSFYNSESINDINWDDITKALNETKTVNQCIYRWKQISKKNIDWFSKSRIDDLIKFLNENLDKVKENDNFDWEKLSKIDHIGFTPIQLELGYNKYIKDKK